MPRIARVRSEAGVYHVMARGINRQDIFLEGDDRHRYLSTLAKVKAKTKCKVYGYCLMNNHVHLLLAEGEDENISETMQRLGSSYVYWYNRKYERAGYLFQDRFLSEPVESDPYLLTVLRYIHQNPVKAGLVTNSSQYVWSSYLAYTTGTEHEVGLTDTEFILDIVGGVGLFEDYHQHIGDISFEAVERKPRATNAQILGCAQRILAEVPLAALPTLNLEERNRILRELKTVPGASCAQIASLVGVGKKVVERA